MEGVFWVGVEAVEDPAGGEEVKEVEGQTDEGEQELVRILEGQSKCRRSRS